MTTLDAHADAVADRLQITELVSRLYLLLDEQRFDELGTVYTDDVELEMPAGRMRGLDEVVAVARARAARHPRMQHLTTDVVVDLDGDRAAVRTNHLAVQLGGTGEDGLAAGLVHRFEAVRTPDGWRLGRGRAEVVWTRTA
jgi:ketosteroid isomerase-like protein